MKRGWHTSEFWIVVISLILLAAAAARLSVSHEIPCAVVASAYVVCRTILKRAALFAESFALHQTKLLQGFSPMAAFDWTNLVASVDTLVENFIASRFPKSSALEPELDAAVAANIALAKKVMDQYALARLITLGGAALDALAAKYPPAAPEIAALKTKLASLGANA